MIKPRLTVRLDLIRHNVSRMVGICRARGIALCGVNKATGGNVRIARLMAESGITQLADSRLDRLIIYKRAGVRLPLLLLRPPPREAIEDMLVHTDLSLQYDPDTIALVNSLCERRKITHKIILMLEAGDLREGIPEKTARRFIKKTVDWKGIDIVGVGANFTCFSGRAPEPDNIRKVIELKKYCESVLHKCIPLCSGGNSANWQLMARGELPAEVNHLRMGEAILLGTDPLTREPIPGFHADTFLVEAEIIELFSKPFFPGGKFYQNAFGGKINRNPGSLKRAIFAIGRTEIVPEALLPCADGIEILGASSDHLVCAIKKDRPQFRVGSRIAFRPLYPSLVQLFLAAKAGEVELSFKAT